MTLTVKSIAGLAAAGLALTASAASAQITVTKHNGQSTDTGTGITFAGATSTFAEPYNFFYSPVDTVATFNGGATTPFGLDITGVFFITTPTSFTFTQGSDDGSYSFLNGAPLISIPGPTNFAAATKTVSLAPGKYTYEVQYSESNGPPGVLQFNAPVPEASTTVSLGLLLALGLGGVVIAAKRNKAGAAV